MKVLPPPPLLVPASWPPWPPWPVEVPAPLPPEPPPPHEAATSGEATVEATSARRKKRREGIIGSCAPTIPGRKLRVVDPSAPEGRHPVVLVHGIWKSRAAFGRMTRYLEARGLAVHALDLVPNDGAAPLET